MLLYFTPDSDFFYVDDLIMDNLKPGDIILFNRHWYDYHIHRAILVKLYQITYGTDYDHCGIFLTDKTGQPLIFEMSPFGKPRLVPFAERILKSRSHLIVTLPLLPRKDLSNDETNSLYEYASRKTSDGSAISEANGVLIGATAMLLKQLQESTGIPFLAGSSTNGYICPNISFISQFWRAMNVHLVNANRFSLTGKDLVDNPFSFNLVRISEKAKVAGSQSSSVADHPQQQKIRLGSNVLLRTK
jgi:hypothetical protein